VFLLASGIHGIYKRPAVYDLDQYYMGGVIARTGAWDSLYPIPNPGSFDHPGYPNTSTLRPKYEELRKAVGADDRTRYILPPPMALLCVPLTWFSYENANAVWIVLMSLCMWAVALQAAHIYRRLHDRSSCVEGLLVVIISGSLLYRHVMRAGNLTPFVGLCIGAATIGLTGERPIRSSLGLVLGFLSKFVTLVFLPLYALVRNWRVLALFVVFLILFNVVTITFSGTEPYYTFATEIFPTLFRPNDEKVNLSAQGLLLRLYGRGHVPQAAYNVVRAAALILGALGAGGLLRSLGSLSKDSAKLFAAATAMIAGSLIFGSQTWGQYMVFMFPAWGYLVWEFEQSWWLRWIPVVSLPLLWAPPVAVRSVQAFEDIKLPPLLEAYELWALLLVALLAIARLYMPSRPTVAASETC
jgi:hypothetical protein